MNLDDHPKYHEVKKILSERVLSRMSMADACYQVYSTEDKLAGENFGACHAKFRPHLYDSGQIIVGLGFTTVGNYSKESKLFKEWIQSSISPWRTITNQTDVEFIEDVSKQKAVIIGPDTFSAVHPNFLKNFAIMCRFLNERVYNLASWYRFVTEYGCDPRDAYLLCKFITTEGGKWYRNSEHDGSHWPLTNPIDYNRYWNGTPKISESINGCFAGTNVINWGKLKLNEYRFESPEPYIERFNEWKKNVQQT